jgi:hypothetical protein
MASDKNLITPSHLPTRRGLLGGAMAALAASPLVAQSQGLQAEGANTPPGDPFIILLTGLYTPVLAGNGPVGNLGLTTVNLQDGSWAKTWAYPVFGVPSSAEATDIRARLTEKIVPISMIKSTPGNGPAIGATYVSLKTFQCVYELPGGAMVQQFAPTAAFQSIVPDGVGGQYNEGTFALPITEANGIYAAFNGGHNHMVDKLHQLVAGTPFAGFPTAGYDEYCFCVISKYQFPT